MLTKDLYAGFPWSGRLCSVKWQRGKTLQLTFYVHLYSRMAVKLFIDLNHGHAGERAIVNALGRQDPEGTKYVQLITAASCGVCWYNVTPTNSSDVHSIPQPANPCSWSWPHLAGQSGGVPPFHDGDCWRRGCKCGGNCNGQMKFTHKLLENECFFVKSTST